MVRVITVETVEPFQASKECSPTTGKVATALEPEPLNASIVGRPVSYDVTGVIVHTRMA